MPIHFSVSFLNRRPLLITEASSINHTLFAEYYEEIRTGRGACFMAVCRGKVVFWSFTLYNYFFLKIGCRRPGLCWWSRPGCADHWAPLPALQGRQGRAQEAVSGWPAEKQLRGHNDGTEMVSARGFPSHKSGCGSSHPTLERPWGCHLPWLEVWRHDGEDVSVQMASTAF